MNDIFNWIMPIIGVIVGAFASYFAQKNLYKKQIEEERLRQRNQFIVEKLEIYSRILRASYEHVLFRDNYNGTVSLDFKKYREIFRPLFYEKLYLIDSEIVIKIKQIDDYLIEADYLETPEYLDQNLLSRLFNETLDFINEEMYEAKEKVLMK